jgi:hypothetical protein
LYNFLEHKNNVLKWSVLLHFSILDFNSRTSYNLSKRLNLSIYKRCHCYLILFLNSTENNHSKEQFLSNRYFIVFQDQNFVATSVTEAHRVWLLIKWHWDLTYYMSRYRMGLKPCYIISHSIPLSVKND